MNSKYTMRWTTLLLIQYTASQCTLTSECNHGECISGSCICNEQWSSPDCNTPVCVYGSMVNGECYCLYGSTLQNGYCDKSCKHGNFSTSTGECVCNKGWRRAIFSDTLNWFKGVCNQFQCQSNYHCALLLPTVTNPQCPIKGSNCYCSHNMGYENDNAKCMGFMYWLSFYAFDIYKYVCIHLYWKIYSVLIVVSIPLGSRRFHCDHHRSRWDRCGRQSRCKGECVRARRIYIRDDLSISIYWFKSMVWMYTFSTCLMLTLGILWSMALWMLIAGILLCVGIMLCCMALSSGGGVDCAICGIGDCGDCGGGCCDRPDTVSSYTGNHYYIYTGGPMPNRNYTMHSTACCAYKWVFVPLLYVLNSYPPFPDNILGGMLGYILGTHILNSTHLNDTRAYILSLTWTSSNRDLRNNEVWRKNVQEYLTTNYAATGCSPSLQSITRRTIRSSLLDTKPLYLYKHRECNVYTYDTPIPPSKVSEINQEFIENKECWICYEAPSQWHQWDCRHVFCQTCSIHMLDIDMPCALCRKVTNNVYTYPLEN